MGSVHVSTQALANTALSCNSRHRRCRCVSTSACVCKVSADRVGLRLTACVKFLDSFDDDLSIRAPRGASRTCTSWSRASAATLTATPTGGDNTTAHLLQFNSVGEPAGGTALARTCVVNYPDRPIAGCGCLQHETVLSLTRPLCGPNSLISPSFYTLRWEWCWSYPGSQFSLYPAKCTLVHRPEIGPTKMACKLPRFAVHQRLGGCLTWACLENSKSSKLSGFQS